MPQVKGTTKEKKWFAMRYIVIVQRGNNSTAFTLATRNRDKAIAIIEKEINNSLNVSGYKIIELGNNDFLMELVNYPREILRKEL